MAQPIMAFFELVSCAMFAFLGANDRELIDAPKRLSRLECGLAWPTGPSMTV
ncbi:MAG: hypothetical protein JW940_08140 [Polyangiaceae bacterium]|nr:hypothetical protein [Polyangiaceae bacterium]